VVCPRAVALYVVVVGWLAGHGAGEGSASERFDLVEVTTEDLLEASEQKHHLVIVGGVPLGLVESRPDAPADDGAKTRSRDAGDPFVKEISSEVV
jgi:hypothetical protein